MPLRIQWDYVCTWSKVFFSPQSSVLDHVICVLVLNLLIFKSYYLHAHTYACVCVCVHVFELTVCNLEFNYVLVLDWFWTWHEISGVIWCIRIRTCEICVCIVYCV